MTELPGQIIAGGILVAVLIVVYFWGKKSGAGTETVGYGAFFEKMNQSIDSNFTALQGEQSDKEALTCNHIECQRRQTTHAYQEERLNKVGLAAFKRKMGEGTPDPLSLCQRCVYETECNRQDDKTINCDTFIVSDPASDVRKSNIEAAESLTEDRAIEIMKSKNKGKGGK